MSNKLKDIFSNKMVDYEGKLNFKDIESHKEFLKALETVQNEGRGVEVNGVTSMTTKVKDGKMEYPFLKHKEITKLVVGPSTEDVEIVLNTKHGEKIILFNRYKTTNKIILETEKNEVVYFKFEFIKNTTNITFTYRAQPHLAKTVKEIVEKYNTALALLNTMFIQEDNHDLSGKYILIHNMKEYLLRLESFFKKLYLLELELSILFSPQQFNNMESDIVRLEELYLLLVEKRVIRLNRKLKETESTSVKMKFEAHKIEVGSKIDLTFNGETEYTIYGQKISIHTANLLSNAIIKTVKEDEEGITKVLYGDTDNQPMYISYMGFNTADEASQELKNIMKHKEKYTEALTLNEQIEKIIE